MTTLITILAFAAVLLAVAASVALLRDFQQSDATRIRRRISETITSPTIRGTLFRNLSAATPMAAEEGEETLSWWGRFRLLVDQSGLPLRAHGVLLQSVGVALLLGIPAAFLTSFVVIPLLLSAVGFALPILRVLYVRLRRLEKLRSQLPDAYSMMSRVMLAGQTSTQAMQLVSSEFTDPIAREFAYCTEQQNLGLPAEAAMIQLARRTGLLEVRMFVVATTVQREAGGNLASILENLSKVIRERFRIRGEVQALTAEGRFQAAVLLLLPFALFGLMYLLNPGHMAVLFEYPQLIVAGFVSELIGAIWIRRIINFDF
ncbi:MAG: type II secretion system F family protein [Planctomycetota bacterium]